MTPPQWRKTELASGMWSVAPYLKRQFLQKPAACILAFLVLILQSTKTNASKDISVGKIQVGAPEIVLDYERTRCDRDDIPDQNPRAFRDANGNVHLIASHYVVRSLIGKSLSDVRPNCKVIYRSPGRADPSQFSDMNWLASFYTRDGLKIGALVHSEYHGWSFAGECNTGIAEGGNNGNCWWNAVTYATSYNQGASFETFPPPSNVVASVPYRFNRANLDGAFGYFAPSNIVEHDGFYYAIINAWSHLEQRSGSCLIRTSDPFVPQSWRAWNGHSFKATFIDPYTSALADILDHVCYPVTPGHIDSLSFHVRSQTYLATQLTPDERYGPPGLYTLTSKDLIHWSKPWLVISKASLIRFEVPGKWDYIYSALLDDKSEDRDFGSTSDNPYLYFIRLNKNNAPSGRALLRLRVNLNPMLP